jgi:hypothetical protein
MKILANGVEIRHDLVLGCLPGGKLWLDPEPDSLTLRDGPGGEPPTLYGESSITLHEVGRYRFTLERHGRRVDLNLVCIEPGLLDWVTRARRPAAGNGGEQADPAMIIRSLCACEWFDGTVACVTTGEPSRSLSQRFGT